MSKKPRTPAELATTSPQKKTYSFSLLVSNMEAIEALVEDANKHIPSGKGIAVSHVIDEAIAYYIENLHADRKK